MSYSRRSLNLDKMIELADTEHRWLIMINADPDALASAMALKRIFRNKVKLMDIRHVNDVKRPDNLSMIRLLKIPTSRLKKGETKNYDKFALVDSQPHHNPEFADIPFSIIVDHHPINPEAPPRADFMDILPDYGATSTIFTEYLFQLGIKPGANLATALLYGIKTDTNNFERNIQYNDIRAFQHLSYFINRDLLMAIVKNEFHKHWLRYFVMAYTKGESVGRDGFFAFMGKVDSSDILVVQADFTLRVYGINWVLICGINEKKIIGIFRGVGLHRDMGALSQELFGDWGTAGGHKTMARAEIPVENVGDEPVLDFLHRRLGQVVKGKIKKFLVK